MTRHAGVKPSREHRTKVAPPQQARQPPGNAPTVIALATCVGELPEPLATAYNPLATQETQEQEIRKRIGPQGPTRASSITSPGRGGYRIRDVHAEVTELGRGRVHVEASGGAVRTGDGPVAVAPR